LLSSHQVGKKRNRETEKEREEREKGATIKESARRRTGREKTETNIINYKGARKNGGGPRYY